MCASWRTLRLAPKVLCASVRTEKFSRSLISDKFLKEPRQKFQQTRLLNMSFTRNAKDLDIKEQDGVDTSFNEADSGFISEKDLSFNCADWSFGDKSKFTVSVEGNIGSGKTTLLEYFKESSTVEALREPIEQWTSIQGKHNALQLLYEDPKRWSFSFNMYAQLTRVQMHMKEHIKPIKLLERSLYSTRHCFVENDYRNNIINGMEYAILTDWFDWLVKSQKADLDLIVYVRADPEVCYERIKKRCRKEEALVPFSLIKDLHLLHEEWLIEQKHFKVPAPVFVLDANKDYSEMKELYETHRRDILCGCV
ncbi:thymidine kinase 2, mitochondrial-like [Babylonia areolata]|uniref:thymidine kinase 2, mitochondrial-like n=1 Tax=Babylonia areolata TaxID=304850 RepID=UPI003FD6232A